MKKIVIFILAVLLNAQELKIISKIFNYYPDKLYSYFKGDVNATKGKDNILADEIKVYLNKNKSLKELIAIGHVKFNLNLDNNTTYKGYSDFLDYNIKSGDIILKGNAFVKKLETNESVKGKYIKINKFSKKAEVKGGKKPAVIIIKVKE
ncbi:lipopolysaccharide export system protein LptA [Lebetimonas natsushimae]|uniref:Lipopolysaccharide export system protein LptA n=1 Tax=Lebetimonas natsushimae TaxID=1936991 RepID=A0A292YG41_9BACT|nr:lipopolysaccharide transport periplasmic protein LptA [Lebetimonas natsushimae]GAX88039.1 lipopolysaccharide export system protein LptA [Lebetimonas natsushimae]